MSNVSQFPARQDQCVKDASRWIAKIDNGLTEEEERELGEWLSQSWRHHEAFREAADLWDRMDSLSRLARIFPEPSAERRPSRRVPTWSIAATVLISIAIIGLGGVNTFSVDEPDVAVTANATLVYETDIGEQSVSTLPDGSEMVLNTNSHVIMRFTESDRVLTLLKGELHVDVAKDPDRPLSVMVGDKVVQAVGTEFNVEITDNQTIELVVTEGVVVVGVADAHAHVENETTDIPKIVAESSTLITAGQEFSIDMKEPLSAETAPAPIAIDEIAIRLSWRDGNLIFRGETLEEAVAEVGRYTKVEFVFLDDASKTRRVAGLFKAGDVDGLLEALRANFNVAYEWQGGDRILLSASN